MGYKSFITMRFSFYVTICNFSQNINTEGYGGAEHATFKFRDYWMLLYVMSITVTSGGDKNRTGGPQVPEPLLT
jgi:hypothetical protein